MRFSSWLRNHSARRTRPVPRFRPRLEPLEERDVPSVVPVTSTLDDADHGGTLRFAVAHARDGDTIEFMPDIQGKAIVLTQGELDLSHSVTIKPFFDGTQTISGGGASRVFEVASGASVTMEDLIITGGNSSPNNPAGLYGPGEGGAITVDAGATLTLSKSTLTANPGFTAYGYTYGDGGAIANFGTLTVTDSTVSANSAGELGRGGGIANFGVLTVSASTVSGNSTLFGGGIWNRGTLAISGSTLSGNTALLGFGNGGAIYNDFDSNATITSSLIAGNTAGVSAGGILNGGTLTLSGCTVSANSAYFGGGIKNSGSLTITGCTVSGNSANVLGGGVLTESFYSYATGSWQGSLEMSDCTLYGNSAGYVGGGIYNGNGGVGAVTLSGCTLSDNSAGFEGGGIYNFGGGPYFAGHVILSNCTLSGNSAALGGGIFNARYGIVDVTDGSTVLGNSAPAGADVYNLGTLFISSDSTVGIIGP
jgi:hypothetical protein